MCNPLRGIRHSCRPETGGARRLFLFGAHDLESDLITWDQLLADGFFSGGIPLAPGKGFVEIEAWYDTTKFKTEMKIGAGFTHALEFRYMGYEADVVRLIATIQDKPVCAMVEGADGNNYWLGLKRQPLIFEVKALLPEKGTARKEVTFTAKSEGLIMPVIPISGDIYFTWLPDWSFDEYLVLVNREFDMSFELAFG